jgi:hypothetical protein
MSHLHGSKKQRFFKKTAHAVTGSIYRLDTLGAGCHGDSSGDELQMQ